MNSSPKGTKEQIAKKLMQQVLAQVSSTESPPTEMNLLQLNNGNKNKVEEQIILEDKSEQSNTLDLSEEIDLDS